MYLIKHPNRDENPQILLALHDDRRGGIRPEPAYHLNLAAGKWMVTVGDSRRAELMSSVLMR